MPRSTNTKLVVLDVSLNSWRERVPSVDEARPACCPGCGRASRTLGCPLLLQGHGLRFRQLRGPPAPGAAAGVFFIQVRRYRCLGCRAVIGVAPRSVMAGRLFTAPAIGLALALWGALRLSAAEVRRHISPHPARGFEAVLGWTGLRRWVRAVRARRLFPCVRRCPGEWRLRQVAERAAATLASLGPLAGADEPLLSRVFRGAAHAA